MHLQEFKDDFYPGEDVTATLENGDRISGSIREKTKFPELYRNDGTMERKAFARYFVGIIHQPDEEAVVDEEHISRDRSTFTKQKLRSFIKNTVTREAWAGAPWTVKPDIADNYRINSQIPPELTQEAQLAQRKANVSFKKGEYDGTILDFFSPLNQLPRLKPKGGKKQSALETAHLHNVQFAEYQRALAGNPAFGRVGPQGRAGQLPPFPSDHPGYIMTNGHPMIAAKGQPPAPRPPPPKYPIEDLELRPERNNSHRPALRYLSGDVPAFCYPKKAGFEGISMESVGSLLETWNTLNVYCEVFQLDSFTFDDYIEALHLTTDTLRCELLIEIHCAILKKLVNDVNDKNGQVQVSLPQLPEPDSDGTGSTPDDSKVPTPTPEPEKPPARSTRSSLAKTEAAELKEADKVSLNSAGEPKSHRAPEIDRSTRGYDWKARCRKRDFSDGKWIVIVVGLINQLSGSPRLKLSCDDVLSKLAPLDKEAIPETAISQYIESDINTRVKILQMLCTLCLETKVIRTYMEDCNTTMTDYRKDRIEVQRTRKAL